ncbi:MAG: hypothetical protein JXL97_00115 [Bacteroidales bacterium]|nr:hypothetical protein [Bacteroidales bacterium]
MKQIFLILFVSIIASSSIFAQKSKKTVEVLYFKANLTCCQAKACNTIEADIKKIIEDNYDENVTFKQVKLDDEANKPLIERFNAKSQTVVLVKYFRTKEKATVDVSEIVKQYAYDKKVEDFSKKFTEQINILLN